MAYRFDVSYPIDAVPNGQDLRQMQNNILRRFPQCSAASTHVHGSGELGQNQYQSTIYTTNDPQEIARVASSLKNADPRIFIGHIARGGVIIYHHPAELAILSPIEKQQYIKVMENLPQTERILHDYLVNLYHTVPT